MRSAAHKPESPVAVITGASGGIAAAIARKLSAEGWRLVLMSRRGCVELAGELDQVGIAGSVLADADIAAAVAAATDRFGRLDGAVASGGRYGDSLAGLKLPPAPPPSDGSFGFDPGYDRDPLDLPFEAWRMNYDMNVLAPMRLFRAAIPHLRAAGGGALLAISGIEALQPRLAYPLGPNRLALHGFVRLLADRYGRDGIRVNILAPGLMENAAAEFPTGWTGMVPLGRMGRLAETAATAAFLMLDGAGYITGQTITVDGGVNRGAGL